MNWALVHEIISGLDEDGYLEKWKINKFLKYFEEIKGNAIDFQFSINRLAKN